MARPAMRTFLFSDLRDYTAFIETKGDQAATTMLRASRRIVRTAVAKHRGAEIKTEGDSFYIVFRSPSPAVRCAMDIQRGAAAHNARHADLPVRMGIGINTGEAVPHDRGYVGSAVVIAGRLSTTCAAGQIVITDTVRALVRTGAHAGMRELGAWTLKGVAEPVRVYEVDPGPTTAARALRPTLPLPAMLSSPARPVPGLCVCPELVQREAPLAALREHAAAAARGETRIVAVSGEGGVGKSRLVREAAESAHREGMYVFGGRSHPSGPPYEPIVAALRPYALARGTEILRRLLGPLVVELRRLLPEVDVGGSEAEIPPDERRERFLRTISLLLEDAASHRPVLLVLEDFHDADEVTRGLLRHLASTLHAGVCVVAVYREEEIGPVHPLRGLLADLERERRLARVAVSPLDLAGVERMTAALVHRRDLASLARAVFERSEGVPFYVEELLKTALDDPNADTDRLALPRTIADSVQMRVSRLVAKRGPGVADLLEATAVAEVPLGYDALLRLSQGDETEAGADLAAAIDAQLLERPLSRTELYQFRHALTREAVVASISPARRRRLHGRVAAALEHDEPRAGRAALLAKHFMAAGEPAKALQYLRRGADEATRVGAYAAAADLLKEAVELSRGGGEERAVLEELGTALRVSGRAGDSEEALVRARQIAAVDGGDLALARLDIGLAAVFRMQGRREDARAAITRAVATLESLDDRLLADALATHAELAWASNEPEHAGSLAARALTLAERYGSTRAQVSALTVLGASRCRRGDTGGRADLERAIAIGVAEGATADAASAYLELARSLQAAGKWEDARETAERGAALARDHGLAFAQARLLTQAAHNLFNQGHYRQARDMAERAATVAPSDTVASTTARPILATTLTMLGEHERALAVLDDAAALPPLDPDQQARMLGARASALLGLGHTDDAWRVACEAIDVVRTGTPYGGTAFVIATEIAEQRGDPGAVGALLEAFDRHFTGVDAAPARVIRAEIDAVLTRLAGGDAASAFAAVADGYDRIGVPIRALYRRAIAAVLDPRGSGAEIARFRSQLAEHGAMRYVVLIDAALVTSGRVLDPAGQGHSMHTAVDVLATTG